MRITLLGLGLIGGSLARAVRARSPETEIVAWSPSGAGPRQALEDGVLARASETVEEAVEGAEIVVVAAPPLAALDLVRQLGGPLRSALTSGATVTDVVSTKSRLVEAAEAAGLPFVGGHPMAGRETTGYGSADPALFEGRPWVIVPAKTARATDVDRVEWLARTAGADPIRMDAAEHDRAVAAISHLPLVLSAALVEAVVGPGHGEPRADWESARRLAAGGWRDMTRLARGDIEMGAGIAATNAGPLVARLRDVQAVLDGWIADLEGLPVEGAPGPDGAPNAGPGPGPDAPSGSTLNAAHIAARLRDARRRLEQP
jgi:prephenate dehydrogenase